MVAYVTLRDKIITVCGLGVGLPSSKDGHNFVILLTQIYFLLFQISPSPHAHCDDLLTRFLAKTHAQQWDVYWLIDFA